MMFTLTLLATASAAPPLQVGSCDGGTLERALAAQQISPFYEQEAAHLARAQAQREWAEAEAKAAAHQAYLERLLSEEEQRRHEEVQRGTAKRRAAEAAAAAQRKHEADTAEELERLLAARVHRAAAAWSDPTAHRIARELAFRAWLHPDNSEWEEEQRRNQVVLYGEPEAYEEQNTDCYGADSDNFRRDAEARMVAEAEARALREAAARRAVPLTPKPTAEPAFSDLSGAPALPTELELAWGAQVHLSNDDSMSLASAQRVLHALESGQPVPASEVRPHELLNYFSFDTVQPSGTQRFEVVASGEQQGDTLSLALAVQAGTPVRRPLNLTLLLDRSGSMLDYDRVGTMKRSLHIATDQLHAGDRVDVVTFATKSCVVLQNYVEGRDDPRILSAAIDSMELSGGTDLGEGLETAYALARSHGIDAERNRRMMLFTDAGITMGTMGAEELARVAGAYEDSGIRLTAVGVGFDVHDDVLHQISEAGKGAYVFLGSEDVAERLFVDGFGSLTQTVAHNVRFALDLPESLAMERFYGETASLESADVQPIHYYAGTTQLFLQDLRTKGLAATDPIALTISYSDAATGLEHEERFETTLANVLGADRSNLHKAQALMAWTDLLRDPDPCGAPSGTLRKAARRVGDAELNHLWALTEKRCASVVATR